jgi:hypothetical protein
MYPPALLILSYALGASITAFRTFNFVYFAAFLTASLTVILTFVTNFVTITLDSFTAFLALASVIAFMFFQKLLHWHSVLPGMCSIHYIYYYFFASILISLAPCSFKSVT